MKPIVLLLAGGQSNRFWPLGDKNLMPMLGKPLLEWQINELLNLGLKDILVVSSPDVLAWSKKDFKKSKSIRFVAQDKALTGMAGAILSISKLYERHYKGRALYVLNANDFYESSLHEEILKASQKKAYCYIAAYQVDKHLPMGYLKMEGSRITGVVEKPKIGREPSDLVNIVAHLYPNPKQLFDLMQRSLRRKMPDDLYEQIMDKLMKENRFLAVTYRGEWKILKYPWHLLDVMVWFLKKIKKSQISKSAQISSRAVVKGKVIIEDGVKILEGAKVLGPCFIGKNSIIGDNSLVRNSVIGENCVIGFSSDITRSYISHSCWTHTNYIGDSVLDYNVSLGSGAVTANLRLDEQNIYSPIKGEKTDSYMAKLGAIVGKNTRIGVNVCLMPGVKVGADCAVGPNVILNKDLSEGKAILISQKLSIVDNKYQVEGDKREGFREKI